MNEELALKILRLYRGPGGEAWDLHAFFDLAGDAADRQAVLETVDALVAAGRLESRGSDFYTLSQAGYESALRGKLDL
jgi:hypothetical protein